MRNGEILNRRVFLKAACASIGTVRILQSGGAAKGASGASLVQRLGYPADARLLIVTADEFGECHASNQGVIQCWEAGLLKSATWVAPGAWALEAAAYVKSHPEMDVGVHLCLATGDVTGMGYRPLLSRNEVPGLYNPQGYMWPQGTETWKHTNVDEVKRESRAQIEQAMRMGINPTHIDPHDGIMQDKGGPHLAEFCKVYGELGKEYNLPLRMPPTQARLMELGLADLRPGISKLGVLMPDEGMASQGQLSYLRKIFHERQPGTVSEIYVHPAVDCAEEQSVRIKGGWWKLGIGDLQMFTKARDEVRQAIQEAGITLVGWREIRELQRHSG